MNRLPFGIGDFVTSLKELQEYVDRIKRDVLFKDFPIVPRFKGDSPGHEFRGNQYSDGNGSSDSGYSGTIKKTFSAADLNDENFSSMDEMDRVSKTASNILRNNMPAGWEKSAASNGISKTKNTKDGRIATASIRAVVTDNLSNDDYTISASFQVGFHLKREGGGIAASDSNTYGSAKDAIEKSQEWLSKFD